MKSIFLGLFLATSTLGVAASPALAARTKAVAQPSSIESAYYTGKTKLTELKNGPLVQLSDGYSRYGHVSKKQYTDLRNAVIAILKRYDPAKHYFIGTGRDPAPITAMLELLGGRDTAMNFPASNIVSSYNNAITPELMGKYFKRLVPDAKTRADILSGRRTIVLYDQTTSGKTPASFEPFLQAYLDQIGSTAKIKKLAIGSANRSGVAVISTEKFPDAGTYLYSPYEGVVSQYPRHVLGQSPMSELKERSQYRSFKKAVLERMKRDRTLHRFINTLNIKG